MKTFILRHDVVNEIEFPIGTIIRSLEQDIENLKLNWPFTFEVVEGDLMGQRGKITDGLEGWVIEDTPENRILLEKLKEEEKHIRVLIDSMNERWDSIPNAVL